MKRVYPSGAKKRQLKKRKIAETAKSSEKISSWLSSSSSQRPTENDEDSEEETNKEENEDQTSENNSDEPDKILLTMSECNLSFLRNDQTANTRDLSESSSNYSENEENSELQNEMLLQLRYFIAPNENDSIEIKQKFFMQHPIQIFDGKGKKLPFDPSKLYYRTLDNGEKIQRKWLSYSIDLNKVYCACCMAFGDHDNRDSHFITGLEVSNKFVYKSVETHENSKSHERAATAAFQCLRRYDITSLINTSLLNKRNQEVEIKRNVVRRLIDIVLFIGKQGIAYRGHRSEGAYTLGSSDNHGNFLELVLLISKYDEILQSHVTKCINMSNINRQNSIKNREEAGKSKKGSYGRGSLLTFLSKDFVNKLIRIIGTTGRNIILKTVRESIYFSLMVDTTQDVSVMDQLSTCIRFVHQGKVHERFINLTVVDDTSGAALYDHIKTEIEHQGLSISNIVACSFDGASNMKGCYSGLQALLKEVNPDLIFTHCMGHVLNLVLADSTTSIIQAENLFGLVEETAVFFSLSYKRMAIWTKEANKEHQGHEKLRRLHTIGATRWWSKHKALSAIVDEEFLCDFKKTSRIIQVMTVLLEISSGSFDSKTKFNARNLLSQWSKFEKIFMSFAILDIFSVTSIVSKYLQCKSLDYAAAWDMVETLLQQIKGKRTDKHFDWIHKKSQEYASIISSQFHDDCRIEDDIELDFPEKRITRRKRMPGEKAVDENSHITTIQRFRMVYFKLIDCIRTSIEERFESNKYILSDCSWLKPKNFPKILKQKDFSSELQSIARLAKVDRSSLLMELKQFAGQYKSFLKSKQDSDLQYDNFEETEDNNSIDSENEEQSKKIIIEKKCNDCLSCAFFILHDFVQSGMFTNLYMVYKFVLTLPCTQVSCERTFSKLKIVKTRLRNSMSEEVLSDLLLMNVERDIFFDLDFNSIIDQVGATSQELKNALLI